MATSHDAIRSTPPGVPNSKTYSCPSYAVGHCPVNGWLLIAAKSVVATSPVRVRTQLRRHRPEIVRWLGGQVHPAVAVEGHGLPAGAAHAFTAARRRP